VTYILRCFKILSADVTSMSLGGLALAFGFIVDPRVESLLSGGVAQHQRFLWCLLLLPYFLSFFTPNQFSMTINLF
jgi:hypothetical protein